MSSMGHYGQLGTWQVLLSWARTDVVTLADGHSPFTGPFPTINTTHTVLRTHPFAHMNHSEYAPPRVIQLASLVESVRRDI